MNKPILKNNQAGQSTLEFGLTLILLMGFVLFYFQLALVLGFGNYVQYATFMSARAFLSSGPTISDQQDRAKAVLVRMLQKSQGEPGVPRFPQIAQGIALYGSDSDGSNVGPYVNADGEGSFVDGSRTTGWLQGVRYNFRGRLFLLSLSGRAPASAVQRLGTTDVPLSWQDLILTSESWLGRETTEQECTAVMAQKAWYYDNGC